MKYDDEGVCETEVWGKDNKRKHSLALGAQFDRKSVTAQQQLAPHSFLFNK